MQATLAKKADARNMWLSISDSLANFTKGPLRVAVRRNVYYSIYRTKWMADIRRAASPAHAACIIERRLCCCPQCFGEYFVVCGLKLQIRLQLAADHAIYAGTSTCPALWVARPVCARPFWNYHSILSLLQIGIMPVARCTTRRGPTTPVLPAEPRGSALWFCHPWRNEKSGGFACVAKPETPNFRGSWLTHCNFNNQMLK